MESKNKQLTTQKTAVRKRKLQGLVVSGSLNKTTVVRVDRSVQHSKYKKIITRSKNYKVHDPLNKCKVGMIVSIEECRPISRHKCWKLASIDTK